MKYLTIYLLISQQLIFSSFGQIPENHVCLERLFNTSNKLNSNDIPQHFLDTIDLTLTNANLVYRKYFYPELKETYGPTSFQFDINNDKLTVIHENDSLVYKIESYFKDDKELFSGDFFLFVKDNTSFKHIGNMSIYYIDNKNVVLKETIYVNKKFLFFKWKTTKVKSVILLELE